MTQTKFNFPIIVLATLVSACNAQSFTTPHHPDSTNIDAAASTKNIDDLFRQHNYTAAIPLLKTKLATHNTNADLQFKLAESLRLSGKPDEALAYYNSITPQDDDIYFAAQEGLALVYLEQHKVELAEKTLLNLLEKDASRWRTINALGVVQSLQNKYDEALEYFSLATSIAPQKASIWNNIGLSAALSGATDSNAITTLTKAFNLASSESEQKKISQNLALAYGIKGDDQKAEKILEPYFSKAAIYNNLGVYAALRDNEALAKSYLSKALTSNPVYYQKAWDNLQTLAQ